MQDAEVTESLDGSGQNYIQFRIFNLGWFSISFVVSPNSWTIRTNKETKETENQTRLKNVKLNLILTCNI